MLNVHREPIRLEILSGRLLARPTNPSSFQPSCSMAIVQQTVSGAEAGSAAQPGNPNSGEAGSAQPGNPPTANELLAAGVEEPSPELDPCDSSPSPQWAPPRQSLHPESPVPMSDGANDGAGGGGPRSGSAWAEPWRAFQAGLWPG